MAVFGMMVNYFTESDGIRKHIMTSAQQRQELQRRIWQIAGDVRGSVDGWDFKQYVLGTLFYRFISEIFSIYIEAGDESIKYAEMPDSVITDADRKSVV